MKLLKNLTTIFFFSFILKADVILIDFETANSGYSASSTEGSGYTDVFNRANPNIGGNNSYMWAVEDISLSDPYITLSQIDISNAQAFTFSIDMLAHHYNDWDSTDELLITYSIDGGTYQNLMWVQNAGSVYNQAAALDTDFDGDGECAYVLPALSTGTSGCTVSTSVFETFSTSTISLSSNTTLDIKLQFNGLTSADEGIYLDNIRIDLFESVTISGNAGFRMMSSPVSGQIYGDLLSELWTQGMTGADVTDGTANVWTLNISSQSWTSLTDISASGNSLTAGTGFLVYVFADNNWDGTDDLPVSLSVSGTENSSSATLGSIADGSYALAGNPYASTIDWDLVTKTNLSATTSVWDDAASGWKSWNGSSGSLTNGLIAPFQGFWIQASGGTGSITIETGDKATSAGTFYRTMEDSTGSVAFTVTSSDYTDQTFMSFRNSGEVGLDNADGPKLMPFQASSRVVTLSYCDETALDIHNLPFLYEGSISIPFDVMSLTLEESTYNSVVEEVILTWNLSELPDHVTLTLVDTETNIETDLTQTESITFSTVEKGSFSANYSGPVSTYPVVGDSRFLLNVTYGVLNQELHPTLPKDFALHPIYPNPFNPSTIISFDLPNMGHTTVDVYDISGRHVDQLLSRPLKPGYHHYTWSPRELASGIYLIQLTTETDQFTQKVTYIK